MSHTTTAANAAHVPVRSTPRLYRNLILVHPDGSVTPIQPHHRDGKILGMNQDALDLFRQRHKLPPPDPSRDIDPRLSLVGIVPTEQLHMDEPFDQSARFTFALDNSNP